MPAMTIERDPPETQRQPGEGEEERPGVLRRLRVPLLFVAACLLGFLLEFGVGLPGTPVWLGVIVAEIAIGLVAWRSNQREGSPGREEAGVDAHAEFEAPLQREPARPRPRQSQLKPPPEPPPPVHPEPQSLPLPHVPVVRPVTPPPEPKRPKAESAEAPSTGIEEALDAAVAAAQDAVSQPRKRNRRGRAERVDEPPATRPDATQGEKAATEQPVAAAEEPVAPAEPRRRS